VRKNAGEETKQGKGDESDLGSFASGGRVDVENRVPTPQNEGNQMGMNIDWSRRLDQGKTGEGDIALTGLIVKGK
jgi:hypothetical protein